MLLTSFIGGNMIDLQSILNKGLEKLIFYAPKLIMALVLLIIGLWIINTLIKLIFKKRLGFLIIK